MMTRSVKGALMIATAMILFGIVGPMAFAASIEGAGFISIDAADDDAEQQLFLKINEERLREGKHPLKRNPELDELARLKAWDMAHHHYFDHVSKRLGTVFDMLQSQGIAYKWAGENIARVPSAAVAHEAFMESADHRSNILSAGYTDVGVGVVRANGKIYVTQIFMRPRAAVTSS